MLLVAVTGGIGSGKSSVAAHLGTLGATVLDADQFAREVVAPGQPALAEILSTFGPEVLDVQGNLDRAALAQIVFADPEALAALEAITHPRIRALFLEAVSVLPTDAIVVHEVPLLAEKSLSDQYHLVIGVQAPQATRRDRLRGRDMAQIEARMASQASDEERSAHCDLVLDNAGSLSDLHVAIEGIWRNRIVPFASNLAAGEAAARPHQVVLVEHNPQWASQAARLIARLHHHLGDQPITHVGSTSVPGLIAKDVIDLQVSVPDLAKIDVGAFLAAGFASHEIDHDNPRPSAPDPDLWPKRLFLSCDPGRAVNLHVRRIGSPGERFARLFPAWLRADDVARSEYAALKRSLAGREGYADLKEPWWSEQEARMERWAADSGWR